MKWTHEKMKQLEGMYKDYSVEELAAHFGVAVTAVNNQCWRQGLYRHRRKTPKKEPLQRPAAIYTNRNSYIDLLNKYAPI